MLVYYFSLAMISLKRNRVITALMILAIGLGIGASMTMATVLHVMSGDPLPGRSGYLYVPVIDASPVRESQPKRATPDDDLTWPDALNLLHAARAEKQAAMSGGRLPIRPDNPSQKPFFEHGHYVTADFFPMFGTPFLAGRGWTREDDESHARVVVLNASLNRKLFGDAPGIGRTVRLKNIDFRVIGVLDDWQPQPTFYASVNERSFGQTDQLFLPLQTAMELNFDMQGRLWCWGSSGDTRTSDHCTWLQFWVQLSNPASVLGYRDFLANYWREQQAHGRFTRPVNVHLYGLMDWLAYQHVIPDDLRLQLWLALGFLGVCMINIVGLLLAKFLRRSGELSVRRALGARRRDLFLQLGMEAAVIGMAGGMLGLGLAELGLWSVRQRPDGYAHLAQMDISMLAGTLLLAVLSSVLAGLLPAWRACNIPPALQLKTQ
ncbi:ABC transporter permease [Dyella caseinilytica]|uniref:ABC transporter permease n=1 Tax=Dyella caseinilytica TaxID=1849581 RepID=A0ABX7GSF0_9GAMM|nr:ABC transporter permease [Dyella caseinilytica]QRN53327.1 ABC transporter permease [Dyella caseinilytica]GGA13261.1 ABC transporter ATP-binding protein [Dyella caseinilytica]